MNERLSNTIEAPSVLRKASSSSEAVVRAASAPAVRVEDVLSRKEAPAVLEGHFALESTPAAPASAPAEASLDFLDAPASAPATPVVPKEAPVALDFLDAQNMPAERPHPVSMDVGISSLSNLRQQNLAKANILLEKVQHGENTAKERVDSFNKTISEALESLDPAARKQVEAKVQEFSATPAFRGVAPEQIMSAYLVANAGSIGAGLSGEAKARFEGAVGSLDKMGDENFQKLVSRLGSPRDRQAAQKVYDEAKKDGKMVIVDDQGRQMIVADPEGKETPQSLRANGGRLDYRMGGPQGVAVVPPDSDAMRGHAAEFFDWSSSLPPAAKVIPPAYLQGFAEKVVGGDLALRTKYGQPPFDLERGMDPRNRQILARLVEDIFQEPVFADASSPELRQAGGPEQTARLEMKWVQVRAQMEGGNGLEWIRDRLSQDWRAQGREKAPAPRERVDA